MLFYFSLVHIFTNLIILFLLVHIFTKSCNSSVLIRLRLLSSRERLSRSGRIPLGVTLTFYFMNFRLQLPKITLSLHTRFCISSLFPNAFFRGTVRRQQKVGLPSTGYNSPSVTVLRLICALVDHENFIFSCLRCRHFNREQGRSVY